MKHHTVNDRRKLRGSSCRRSDRPGGGRSGVGLYNRSADRAGPLPVDLPTTPQSYLGVYAAGTPASYDGVTAFAGATGAKPDVVMYYSGWFVPFPAAFAATVASNGAVPLVQMDPDNISVAGIAAGRYDGYLTLTPRPSGSTATRSS